MKKESPRAPTGMHDVLPEEAAAFRRVEEAARRLFESWGYEEIRTPMVEEASLFVRTVGEATDVVEKEMFRIADDSTVLRPEGTAPVARAYVEHAMHKRRIFRKFFYTGPFFRRERPQKGRLRQFHQLGVEMLGPSDPLADAEVVLLAHRLLKELGLEGFSLHINSMGCPACREDYRRTLCAYLEEKLPSLCGECRRRFERNVLRILDCKKDKEKLADAPSMVSHLCSGCRAHHEAVLGALRTAGETFIEDALLVRGFDYYTRTVFEIVHEGLGAQNAVAAGGRYDGLVASLGGPEVSGVGFSAGLERIVLLLPENHSGRDDGKQRIFCVSIGEKAKAYLFPLVLSLRAAGVTAEMDYMGRSPKAQMREAQRSGCSHVIIAGDDEISAGTVVLKEMATGRERLVTPKEAVEEITRAGG